MENFLVGDGERRMKGQNVIQIILQHLKCPLYLDRTAILSEGLVSFWP